MQLVVKKAVLLLLVILVLLPNACANGNTGAANYTADWDSLSQNDIPEWLKDAKFGVYTHWGVYSIPAKGGAGAPLRSMYKRQLSDKPEVFDHINAKYGPAEKFGYKDFIPMFTAPKFNADEWAWVMKDAGAKFGGICVVHHDGFLLWDSEVNRWNSRNMGPKRDIYGEIAQAVRKQGLKLAATFHHGRTFGFCIGKNLKGWTREDKKKLDIFDPAYKDFYWHDGHSSRKEFSQQWKDKILEVIDNYEPDILWFDGLGSPMANDTPPESYAKEIFAHYFNKMESKGKDVTVCNKHTGTFNFPEDFGLLCYENGRSMEEDVEPWFLIDRAIAYPWAYEEGKNYARDNAEYHTRSLIDVVSRGGIFFLSLTPKGDGSIRSRYGELAILEFDIFLRCLEKMGGNFSRFGSDFLQCVHKCHAADCCRARTIGTHAKRHLAGVTVDDINIVEINTECLNHELRERSLMSLAMAVRTGKYCD